MSVWDDLIGGDTTIDVTCDCGGQWGGTGADEVRDALEQAQAHAKLSHVVNVSIDVSVSP